MSGIALKPYREEDYEIVAAIMTRAFNEDSVLHRGFPSGPEGYDDGSFIRKYTVCPGTTSYTIYDDEKPVGLTILWIHPESHENFLGCIFTDPDTRGRGVGARVWRIIEETYPDTRVWRTETPLCSTRNMHFYINKCGFMAYRIENPKNRDEALVQFVKFTDKWRG